MDRVLRDPFDADGIPLRLAAYVMGPAPLQSPVPKTGVEVLIAGEVRLDVLETRREGTRLVAEPKLTLLASSRSGESHDSDWKLQIALSEGTEGASPTKAWHPFLTRIAMEPGDHRARLVVESGGRVGSVTTDFVVPDFAEERLSTPILSDQPRATAGFVARSADGQEWASGAHTAMSLEAGKPTRLVSLPLADAPPGESELVLTVRDEVSRRTFQAREPFRVEPIGPTPATPDPAAIPEP